VIRVTSEKVPAGREMAISAALLDARGAAVQPASIIAVVAVNGALPARERPMQPVAAAGHQFELRVPVLGRAVTFGWAVRAKGEFEGGLFDRVAAGAFRARRAGGGMDASAARVEKRNGDLELIVPAGIQDPGTYWVYAELWGGAGGTRPIAFARRRFENVCAGARVLSVTFSGAIIRQSGIDGPYLVRNLKVEHGDGEAAPEEEEAVPSLPPTAAYRAAEFDADTFKRELRLAPLARRRPVAIRRRA
jgi:hypothetical protein